ncbi:DUF2599 domain-containing protein [Oerskovia sp. NPDC057915]|uniref:DUF2599 domain-containing protein n=1 Tax=Oerskovia sp. NPDC057915 TaxID=3346280 RepID=UPI0036DEC414
MTSLVRLPRPRATLVVGTVVAVLLTGCSLPDGVAPVRPTSAASEGAASGEPSPSPATERPTVTKVLSADGIELVLTVPLGTADEADGGGPGGGADGGDGADGAGGEPVTVTPDEDGSSRVAFVLPADGATTGPSSGSTPTGDTDAVSSAVPATLDLVSPADGSLVRNSDASITVLDAAGTPLGGLSAPEATETSGSAGRAGVVVVAPTRAEVHAKAWGATPSGSGGDQGTDGSETGGAAGPGGWTVTTWLGAQGVRSATWGEREGGRSLAVDPTPWARQSGIVGEATAWAQLVASEPEAASRTMRDQFDCHALGATDKKTWNLEPWRPDVGFLAMAAARCNPTP